MLSNFLNRNPKGGRRRRDDDSARRGEGAGMRPMLATYDRLGQTLVATLVTSQLSGNDAQDLAEELLPRLETPDGTGGGCRHVVLDLQNVGYMDSSCVGALVELFTKLQDDGGRIALVNADRNVEYLFKLTRLDRLFPLCRDVMSAIEAVERAA